MKAAESAQKAAEEAAKAAAESGKAAQEAANAAQSASDAAASAAAAAKSAEESAGYANDAAQSARDAQIAQKAAEDAQAAAEAAQKAAEEERLAAEEAQRAAEEAGAAAEAAQKAAEQAALKGAKYQTALYIDSYAERVDQSGYNKEQTEALVEIVSDVKAAIAAAESIEQLQQILDDAKARIDAVADMCPSKVYTDVEGDAWYHESVDYMIENGYMNGVSDSLFDVNGSTTRAQLVTILYRVAGEPSVEGLKNPFTDVTEGTWYTNAVIWAANEGIVKGVNEETFAPNNEITREQIVTILYRCDGEPVVDEDALAGYSDAASVSEFAVDAMNWAIANGIINGVTETTLAPTETATRAQISTILMRRLAN